MFSWSRLLSCWMVLIGLFGTHFPLSAQKSIQDSSISMVILDVSYRGAIPGGDLKNRLGFTSLMGIDVGVKFSNQLYLATGLQIMFSESANISGVLDPLLVPGDLLIADNGLLSDIRVLGSGLAIPLSLGVLLPIVPRPNPNSGLFVEVGGQYFQHKLNIRATEDEVSGLNNEYIKGYDRLTSGFGVRESIGYRYFANNGYVNFAIGLDFSQNFTRSRRSIDFSTGQRDLTERKDLLFGIRASWSYPLYRRAPSKAYYY